MGNMATLIFPGTEEKLLATTLKIHLIQDIASALKFMHDQQIAHRDLKPENCLLEQRHDRIYALLTDFGVSQVLQEKLNIASNFNTRAQNAATIRYAAPEVLRDFRSGRQESNSTVNKAADVFSFGALVFAVTARAHPWE